MKNIQVMVTEADIKLGTHENCNHCPVALAINRGIVRWHPELKARVMPRRIWLKDKKGAIHYSSKCPDRVERFINDFDFGYAVEPFSFKLQFSK